VLLQNSAENQLLIEVPNDPLEHTLPLELLVSTDPGMISQRLRQFEPHSLKR